MIPGTHNFRVARGSSGPTQGLVVRLKAPTGVGGALENIPFTDVRLSIYKRKELLIRVALSDAEPRTLTVSDVDEAEIQWAPTPEQSRLIPEGTNKAHYELEVWHGGFEVPYLQGGVSGVGGINDDGADDGSDSAGS